MRRLVHFTCLLILTLTLVACGSATQAGQRTPVASVQTAVPLPTATTQPTAQPTAAPTETTAPTALPQVQVTRAVNLRTGPSTSFSVIRTLRVETTVELIAQRDENGERWYQVRVGDNEGWVSGAIVQVDASQAAALPINSESFTPPTSTPRPTVIPKPTVAPKPLAVPAVTGGRVGAICRDGTRSNATGRGACSHHGGVDHWLYQ
jgi:uncharacterized protein YgiM (DUF1202 family)